MVIITTEKLLVLVGIAIPLFSLILSIIFLMRRRKDNNYKFQVISILSGKKFKLYPRKSIDFNNGIYFLKFIFLIFLYRLLNNTDVDFSDIGIKYNYSFLSSFLIGILIYFIFIAILKLTIRLPKFNSIKNTNNYLVFRQILPRNKSAKLYFIISVCILNPFIEEIIYRGILVYYIGNYFNIYWLSIIIGLVFCLGVHLYQGVYNMYFHLLFYFISVALLFSPLGLVASFGLHFAGDIFPTLNIRKSIKEFRKENKIVYIKNVA
jgi:membrane protease YdiL (CAAX protease family)